MTQKSRAQSSKHCDTMLKRPRQDYVQGNLVVLDFFQMGICKVKDFKPAKHSYVSNANDRSLGQLKSTEPKSFTAYI